MIFVFTKFIVSAPFICVVLEEEKLRSFSCTGATMVAMERSRMFFGAYKGKRKIQRLFERISSLHFLKSDYTF